MAESLSNVFDILSKSPGVLAVVPKAGGYHLKVFGRVSLDHYETEFGNCLDALMAGIGIAALHGLVLLIEPTLNQADAP